MRFILEKPDIIKILNKHFDSEFDPTQVVIRTDPVFEIELRGIPLSVEEEAARQTPEPEGLKGMMEEELSLFRERAHGTNASLETPAPGADGLLPDTSAESPLALVQRSREIAESLARTNPELYAREPRRRDGTANPPNTFNEEIS